MDQIIKYRSKNKTISRSRHHANLWIIDYDNGGFCTITASQDIMLAMNPVRPGTTPRYGNILNTFQL